MNPDLDIALALLKTYPERYAGSETYFHVLAEDTTSLLEALFPMKRFDCTTGQVTHLTLDEVDCMAMNVASNPIPERPGCPIDECPRNVALDAEGYYETHCERHLIERLRENLSTLQAKYEGDT